MEPLILTTNWHLTCNGRMIMSLGGVLFDKSQSTLIQFPKGKYGSYSIPNSVTNFGMAFYTCQGLTTVTIPASVTSIGDWAFGYCSGLKTLTIPASINSIGVSAFYSCTSLASLIIPDTVISIGTNSFYSCSSLTNVIIGNGVTNIGSTLFSSCSSLVKIRVIRSRSLWAVVSSNK